MKYSIKQILSFRNVDNEPYWCDVMNYFEVGIFNWDLNYKLRYRLHDYFVRKTKK